MRFEKIKSMERSDGLE